MRELRTEIQIAAPAEKVWDILMDFNNWYKWNPIVNEASGVAASGSTLSITMTGNDGKDGPKYKPSVTKLEKPNYFRWRAKMMAGFIFTNDKVFELECTNSGTHLVHKELYSGLMSRIFWSKLDKFVPSMLSSMNAALKELAERDTA